MSAYAEYETQFKDPEILKQALCEMNWRSGKLSADQIEMHDKPVSLYGYLGDKRADVANVVIRRDNVGSAANDIGFVKTESGNMKAVISSYDSSYYNGQWMTELTKTYSEKYVEQKAKKMGYRIDKKKVDGKIRMTLSRWR